MMTKTTLALAALALLQIVPAAEAASKKHHAAGADSAYAYAPYPAYPYAPSAPRYSTLDYAPAAPRGELSPSNYYYAQAAYGWNAGLYPFNFAPDGRRIPLRSGSLCWAPSTWGNPEWAPCS